MLVLGQAGLVWQRVVREDGVVPGGAGAVRVGEAGRVLLGGSAQVQILLRRERGRGARGGDLEERPIAHKKTDMTRSDKATNQIQLKRKVSSLLSC